MAKTRVQLMEDLKAIVAKAQALQTEIVETFKRELAASLPVLLTASASVGQGVTNAQTNGKPLLPVPKPAAKAPRKRNRATKVTTWTASKEAKRVPDFVLEATQLSNKAEVIAKYGEDAAFIAGGPLPQEVAQA